MRRSRLKIFAVVVAVLAATCWWAWQNRDRIAPNLVNPLLEGSQVESIRGLDLGFKSIHLEQLTLTLESGSKIALRDIHLQQPFDLLLGAEKNRSRLTIAELGYLPAPQIATAAPATGSSTAETAAQAPTHAPAKTQSPGESPADELRLGELLQSLYRYLPERIEIDDLRWLGGPIERGRLTLARDHGEDRIDLRLVSGQRRLNLQLHNPERQLGIRAELRSGDQQAATLSGRLAPLDTESWNAQLQLKLELELLRQLPLPGGILEVVASATGTISSELNTSFPDRLLRPGEYRDTVARLSADDATFTLPQSALGAPLRIALDTPEAVTVAFASLQPFRPKDISGSGKLAVIPLSANTPLLDADIATEVVRDQPLVSVAGAIQFGALSPLLQSQRWKSVAGKVELSAPEGRGSFRGTAKLKPLARIAAGDAPTIGDIEFTLLPKTRFGAAVAGNDTGALGRYGWPGGTVSVELIEPLTLKTAQWPGAISLAAPALELQARPDNGDTAVSARATDVACRIDDDRTCTLALSSSMAALALPAQEMTGENASFSAQLDFSVGGQQLQAELRDAELAVERLRRGTWTLQNVSLQSPQLQCLLAAGKTACSADALTASSGSARMPEMEASGSIELMDLSFAIEGESLQSHGKYRSDDLHLQLRDQYGFDTSSNGDFTLAGGSLDGKSELRVGPIHSRISWQHQLGSGRGRADFELPPTDFNRDAPLSDTVTGLPADLVSGSIAAEGRISWPQGGDSGGDRLWLTLEQVAAVYGDMFAVDISGTIAALQRDGLWITEKPQPMQIDSVDVGLPIDNIRFALSLDPQRDLNFTNLGAELLGGQLQSSKLTWNLDGKERRSEIHIDGISLEKLTGEMEVENFAASGVLDLQIPLLTGEDGITVEQGQVEARPPGGRLRYYGAFSPSMLAGNPQLKLIAGALEDYNYRELSGTLEYPLSGDMQLQLKLVGRSDSIAEDRDLVINLNLENNIPDMLRSLQAGRDLTGALEKELQ